jgi:hypothetical protein
LVRTLNEILNKARLYTIITDQTMGGGTLNKDIIIHEKLKTRKGGQK